MGTANFQPNWWNKQVDGSAWDRVKAAMQRDWEQTKHDFTPGAPDLNQDVDDTVKMATGKAPIPRPGIVTPPSKGEVKAEIKEANKEIKKTIEARRDAATTDLPRAPWRDVESPVAYGFAAKNHYSKKYPSWDVELERELRGNKDRTWDDMRDHVRTGFNAPR
jgi:hypothetical protein